MQCRNRDKFMKTVTWHLNTKNISQGLGEPVFDSVLVQKFSTFPHLCCSLGECKFKHMDAVRWWEASKMCWGNCSKSNASIYLLFIVLHTHLLYFCLKFGTMFINNAGSFWKLGLCANHLTSVVWHQGLAHKVLTLIIFAINLKNKRLTLPTYSVW